MCINVTLLFDDLCQKKLLGTGWDASKIAYESNYALPYNTF